MKKLLSSLIVSLMIFGLFGCFEDDKKEAKSLQILSDSIEVVKGETLALNAELVYDDGTVETDVQWTSLDSLKGTINSNGVFTAVGYGDVKIQATKGDKMSEVTISVVALNIGEAAIATKEILAVSAAENYRDDIVEIKGKTINEITWKSSNTDVATVTDQGVVTTVAKGFAVITATITETYEAQVRDTKILEQTREQDFLVAVADSSDALEIFAEDTVIGLGDKLEIISNKAGVEYSVSDSDVATIDADGSIVGIALGSVTVTATLGEETATLELTVLVVDENEKVELDNNEKVEGLEEGYIRIYFTRDINGEPASLEGIHAHIWSDNENGATVVGTSWPGIELTGVEGDFVYVDYKIDNYDGNMGVIINAGGDPKYVEMELTPNLNTEPARPKDLDGKIYKMYFRNGTHVQYKDANFTVEPTFGLIIRSADWITSNEVEVELNLSLTDVSAFTLVNTKTNEEIELTGFVKENEGDKVGILTTAIALDTNATYSLKASDSGLEADAIAVGIGPSLVENDTENSTYSGDDLGATLNADGSATLKVWSPFASEISVYLYDKDNQSTQIGNAISLTKVTRGVWTVDLNYANTGLSNLEGYLYQYEVTTAEGTRRALDPYAKSMAAFSPRLWEGEDDQDQAENPNGHDWVGKAAIIDINSADAGIKPVSIGNTTIANSNDMVAYEVHVRDFTSDPSVSGDLNGETPGTYLAFANFTNGIEHLKDLGITHVQLLPVHNFYTVDEFDKSYMAEGNGSDTNFNWGYDPHNYFTPEGWYSTDPADPYSRIKEYRELINTLHENGIGVIMDVVYNHTYSNDVFNNVAPGLYYRAPGGSTPVGSPAVASERTMVRKLIIDSLKYYVEEFGVDGFRFDLMGFIDAETMKIARKELGKDVILQGEAWNFTDLDATEAPVKGVTSYEDHGIADLAYFNDTTRDSYGVSGSGSTTNSGFLLGTYSYNQNAKAALIAGLKEFENGGEWLDISTDDYLRFSDEPSESLNFLSIHDGFTLWDKFNIAMEGTLAEKVERLNQSSAMMFTSQGKIIMQSGDEIARTKPLGEGDPESGRVNENTDNIVNVNDLGLYYHENSYKSSDYTNMIRWERKTDENFSKIFDYTKGLIDMRRNIPAFRYSNAADIRAGVQFIGETEPDETDVVVGPYSAFSEIETFTINFVNAPDTARGLTWYLAGEATPGCTGGGNDGNTADLADVMHSVAIDENGAGSLTFTAEDIAEFVLDAWGATEDLNFKLVANPGEWDSPSGSYTGSGNNRILATAILEDDTVVVDLSMTDYAATGEAVTAPEEFIAYTLDNTLEAFDVAADETGTDYTHLIVVHNASAEATTVVSDLIVSASDWVVIMDGDNAGTTAILDTDVVIADGQVTVPANTSTVIATSVE